MRTKIGSLLSGFLLVASFALTGVFSLINVNSANAQANCTLPTDYGTITHNIQPQSSATYKVWVRLWVPSGATSSAKLSLNSLCKDLPAGSSISSGAWVWVDKAGDGSTLQTSLNSGTNYQMVLAGSSGGVRVDRVLLLTDNCVPTNFGDNCTVVDTTAPDISISSPANGQTVNGFVPVTVNISDTSDVKTVELLVGSGKVAQSTTAPYSMSWDSRTVTDGSYILTARVTDPNGNTNLSAPITINVLNNTTPPPSGVSSKIPVDAYNQGGQGVAYNDTSSGNLGDGTCRNDDVDLKVGEAGSCVLGWFATGEWLQYDISVAAGGTYTLRTNASSGDSDGGVIRYELDGTDITGAINITPTGSYDQFATYDKQVRLTAGNHTLRLVNVEQYLDVAWFEFWGPGSVVLESVTPPPPPPPADVVSLISADAYNNGGQNVGYYDKSPGNLGDGACRNDDVDMKASADGTCTIAHFATGEWLKYDVNVSAQGTYTMQIKASRGMTGDGKLHLEVDNQNITGDVLVPSTGSWDEFTVVNVSLQLPEGDHTLKLVNDLEYFDVDWLQFVGPGTVTLRDTTVTDPPPDSTPPSQPTGLSATSVTQTSLVLNWNPSQDTGFGVVGYAVYRNGTLLEAVAGTTFADDGLSAGTTYRYEVSALDGAGNESARSVLNVTTQQNPTPPSDDELSADLNSDGVVDKTDVDIFKDWYRNRDQRADFNEDGQINVSDWAIFRGLWKQGI